MKPTQRNGHCSALSSEQFSLEAKFELPVNWTGGVHQWRKSIFSKVLPWSALSFVLF
jgi:hypothetical protein